MENEFKRASGYSLLIGSVLATLTMMLHPSGGDIAHIVHLKSMLIQSHSIAIFCLPFIGFGFWGLSNLLQTKSKVSMLGFFIFCFGLVAAMIAATINGLTLPLFASDYSNATIDTSTIKAIMVYGKYINISMTGIFIAATSISIALWSVIIIRTTQLTRWVGYFGLAIIAFGLLGVFSNFNFTNLFGFRMFILGLVSWKVVVAFTMLAKTRNN